MADHGGMAGIHGGHSEGHGSHHGVHHSHDRHGLDSGAIYGGNGVGHALAIAHFASDLMGGGGLHGYSVGHVADILPGHHSGNQAHDGDGGRTFTMPGIANDDPAQVEVTVYFHGPCNVQLEIDRLATDVLGLTPIHPRPNQDIPYRAEQYDTKNFITAATAFLDPKNPVKKSNGYFRLDDGTDCPGVTKTFRRFYQSLPTAWKAMGIAALIAGVLALLVVHSVPFALIAALCGALGGRRWGKPKFESWRTYLAVSGVTWNYKMTTSDGQPTEDCETRVTFLVYCNGEIRNGDGMWDFDWDAIKVHRILAEKLARGTQKYLNSFKCDPRSVQVRSAIKPEYLLPPKPLTMKQPAELPSGAMPVPPTWEPDTNPNNPASIDFGDSGDNAPARGGYGGTKGTGIDRRD